MIKSEKSENVTVFGEKFDNEYLSSPVWGEALKR